MRSHSTVNRVSRTAFVVTLFAALLSCRSFVGPPPVSVYPAAETDRESTMNSTDTKPLPEYLKDHERTAVEIYRKVNRGVVNVSSVSVVYSRLFLPYPREGAGSGAIIREDGVVITNYHVIEGAQKLTVTLYDGSAYDARVIGFDAENDIALLKFDPQEAELTVIELGTSSDLLIGQQAFALGNPFGLGRTLTTGTVSAVNRPLQSGDGYLLRNLIQTDASINPGNSGGPLLDTRGRIIGINTMILSTSGGSIGIGFAVAVDTVKRIIPDLITRGTVNRGWIEIVPIPIYPALANRADLPLKSGILVSSVRFRGNADTAGVIGGKKSRFVVFGGITIYLGGDIITAVDGKPVATISDYFAALEETKPGDTVQLDIFREGDTLTISVDLSDRPQKFGY